MAACAFHGLESLFTVDKRTQLIDIAKVVMHPPGHFRLGTLSTDIIRDQSLAMRVWIDTGLKNLPVVELGISTSRCSLGNEILVLKFLFSTA